MRQFSLVGILVSATSWAAITTPDGIDSQSTGLDGSGVLIGQAEVFRSAKAGYDPTNHSSANTVPTGVYFQNDGGMASPDEHLNDASFTIQHATTVAQQMIGRDYSREV
jgi:hypothetical protein